VGALIAPATMPEVTIAPTGGPRITQSTVIADGTSIAFEEGRLVDTTLGVGCSFAKAADGKLRCLPEGASVLYFSDDQCKAPLGITSDDCAPVKYIQRVEGPACGTTAHVYLPGAQLDPKTTPAWFLADGMCMGIGGTSATKYFALGAEVPATTFAEGAPTKR
jgi:hypothetical protein